MKAKVCTCSQCRAARRNIRKKRRNQTRQIRAAKRRNRELLKKLPVDEIDDKLETSVSLDYFA